MMTLYITCIETDAPEIYDGPRVSAFVERAEAEHDLIEWVAETLDRPESDFQSAEQARIAYFNATGRIAKLEVQ